MMAEAGADLFNRTCFKYPTLGDLYKYATYAAMLILYDIYSKLLFVIAGPDCVTFYPRN